MFETSGGERPRPAVLVNVRRAAKGKLADTIGVLALVTDEQIAVLPAHAHQPGTLDPDVLALNERVWSDHPFEPPLSVARSHSRASWARLP